MSDEVDKFADVPKLSGMMKIKTESSQTPSTKCMNGQMRFSVSKYKVVHTDAINSSFIEMLRGSLGD